MPRRTPLQEAQMLAGLPETGDLTEVNMDADQERLYDDLMLRAENEGSFYRKKDAKGAVEYSFKEYLRDIRVRAREDYSVVKAQLIKDLAKRWAKS